MIDQFSTFTTPYAHHVNGMNVDCTNIPRVDLAVAKWQMCTASKSFHGNMGSHMCECKHHMNADDQCEFVVPGTVLVGCVLDKVNLFACKKGGSGLWPAEPFDVHDERAYDLDLPPVSHSSKDKLGVLEKKTLSILTNASYNSYLHNVNQSCKGDKAATEFLKETSGFDTILPHWTLVRKWRPEISNKDEEAVRYPMAQMSIRETMNGRVSLAFVSRGTATVADVFADVDTDLVPIPNEWRGLSGVFGSFPAPRVHRGFYTYSDVFADEIIDYLLKDFPASSLAHKQVDRVLISGHSLGGFLSLVLGFLVNSRLAALRRAGELPAHVAPSVRVDIVAIGAYQPGDENFAALYNHGLASIGLPPVNSRILRFELDPFTALPCDEMAQCGRESPFTPPGSTLPSASPDSRGQIRYGKLAGELSISRREGMKDHLIPRPGTNANVWRTHMCTYKCAAAKWVGVKNSPFCTRKGCNEKDFNPWSRRFPFRAQQQHHEDEEEFSASFEDASEDEVASLAAAQELAAEEGLPIPGVLKLPTAQGLVEVDGVRLFEYLSLHAKFAAGPLMDRLHAVHKMTIGEQLSAEEQEVMVRM